MTTTLGAIRRRDFLATTAGLVAAAAAPRIGWSRPAAAGELPGFTFEGNDPRGTLPRTVDVIQRGIDEGLHVGCQLYVAVGGETRADFGMGASWLAADNDGEVRPMTPRTLNVWYSSTKPLTTACALLLWQRGKFDLDVPVAEIIPEFAQGGKERVTVRQVMTHTSGFPRADGRFAATEPWDLHLKRICAAPLAEGWRPGLDFQYHPGAGMFILGEIVQRLDERPFSQFILEELFLPLGMTDCRVGMDEATFERLAPRIGLMYRTDGEEPVAAPATNRLLPFSKQVIPGWGGRGPMRQFAQFYEMLRRKGRVGDEAEHVLEPGTVETMAAQHNHGVATYTDRARPAPPRGLGVSVDSVGFGLYCSPRTFGHGGSLSSVGYCDPDAGLVVGLVFNGRPSRPAHGKRMIEVANALYLDLGLAREEDGFRKDKVERLELDPESLSIGAPEV